MSNPNHQQIELRAYQLWEGRGRPWGDPEADWLKAEEEFMSGDGTLTNLARNVGTALGTVIAFLNEPMHPSSA
jgi:Protein of unknown function (DUF2934)